MNILLMDIDSMLWQSGFCPKDDDPEGEGFVRDQETAFWKFEEGVHRVFNQLEDTYQIPIHYYKMFCGGGNNFRKIVNPTYKANRTQSPPPMYEALKHHAILEYNAFVSEGVEAHDSVAATWKLLSDSIDDAKVILCSMDKDFKQLPCYFFDYYHTRFDLHKISDHNAAYNFYTQMLMGDSVDNVKGIPKIGVKRAAKILGVTTPYGYFRRAYQQYVGHYGRKSREQWFINKTMLKLHTHNVETPSFPEDFNQVG